MNIEESTYVTDTDNESSFESCIQDPKTIEEDYENYPYTNSFSDYNKKLNFSEKFKDEYQHKEMQKDLKKKDESIMKNLQDIFINFRRQIEDLELKINKIYYTKEYNESSKPEITKSYLGKKTERFNIKNNEVGKIDYRFDYYKKDFLKSFIAYIQEKIQNLIINCHFCKKFGNTHIHMPNRKLYTGNTNEKDNKEFISKTIELVFKDYEIDENINDNKDGFSRQKKNEELFNRIYAWYESLKIKKEKDIKYLEQYNNITKLIEYLNKTIDEVLDEYYDSGKFDEFKSSEKIQYYDEKFKKERNRNFSLLDKGGFRQLVNIPFYSDKTRTKKK